MTTGVTKRRKLWVCIHLIHFLPEPWCLLCVIFPALESISDDCRITNLLCPSCECGTPRVTLRGETILVLPVRAPVNDSSVSDGEGDRVASLIHWGWYSVCSRKCRRGIGECISEWSATDLSQWKWCIAEYLGKDWYSRSSATNADWWFLRA